MISDGNDARLDGLPEGDEGLLLAIVAGSPIPAFISRLSDGRILVGNEKAGELLGVDPDTPPEDVVTPQFYATPETRDKVVSLLRREGRIEGLELPSRRADGSVCWLLISLTLILFQGEPAIYGTMLDVTAQREQQDALTLAKEEAESASRAKTEFLAVMNHEVRTPMNGILSMAQLLAETPLTEGQREYVETIRYSAEAVLAIANDGLDIARIEAGGLAIEHAEFDLPRLFDSLGTMMGPRAREKGVALETIVLPGTPTRIRGAVYRLRQILLNLMGNAIKFTSEGRVTLSVEPVAGKASGCRLRFSVSDTGPGIAESQRDRVFEPFFQSADTHGPMPDGAGLGLTLCRRLADALGADLTLSSVVGEGTTFSLTLDFETSAEPGKGSTEDDNERVATQGLTVLVVDDIALNRTVARTILNHDGHQAVEAENGEAAIFLVGERDFDAVLLDLQLPGIDGYEVLRGIRMMPEPEKASLPILAMTGNVMRAETDRMAEAGFDGIVPKPVDIRNLRRALMRAVRGRELEGVAVPSDPPHFDPRNLEDLVGLMGVEEAMPVLLRFREALDKRADALWNARTGDRGAVKDAAHKLAGAAGNCGLMRLQALLCDLETKAGSGSEHGADLTAGVDAALAEAGDVTDAVDKWISRRLKATQSR